MMSVLEAIKGMAGESGVCKYDLKTIAELCETTEAKAYGRICGLNENGEISIFPQADETYLKVR